MRGKENISHKNIVLTGAASGIGFEILKLLADPKYGNIILAVDLNASDLDGFAPNVIPLKADITVKEQIDLIFEKPSRCSRRLTFTTTMPEVRSMRGLIMWTGTARGIFMT